jgi:hypothetical protein
MQQPPEGRLNARTPDAESVAGRRVSPWVGVFWGTAGALLIVVSVLALMFWALGRQARAEKPRAPKGPIAVIQPLLDTRL